MFRSVFAASGSFAQVKADLYRRDLKAFVKQKSIFGDLSPNMDTSLHIFDHRVKPILLYGSEIWGGGGFMFAIISNFKERVGFKLEKA